MPLGIPIVLSVGVVPTSGLKVGESGGPAIRSTATTGPGIGIHILYLVLGWKGNSTYIIFSRRRNNLFNRFSYDPIHMSWNDLFNQLRDSSPNFFRDDNRSGCSDILIFVFSQRFCRTHFCSLSYKRQRQFALANRCCDTDSTLKLTFDSTKTLFVASNFEEDNTAVS